MGAELDPIIEQAAVLPTVKESVEHLLNGIAAKFAEAMNDSTRHRALVTEVQECASRAGDAVLDNTTTQFSHTKSAAASTFGQVTEKDYTAKPGTPTPHDVTYEVPPKVNPTSPFSQSSTTKNPVPTNEPISNHPPDPGDHANSFSERDTGKAPETKPNPHSAADEDSKPHHTLGKKK